MQMRINHCQHLEILAISAILAIDQSISFTFFQLNKMFYLEELQQFQMRSLKIRLERNEELTPDFLDLFSKLIINNTDFFYGEHIQEQAEMQYREFHEYLLKSCHFKHSGLKSPMSKWNRVFTFNFQSKSNNVVFLLDLSPYMLIYNYGTKSFPLKNLEQIVIHLLKKLCERAKKDKSYDYRVTIYLFSIYRKQFETIIINEPINENNFELLCEFINKTIQKSTLPYEKSTRKESLREIFQQMFNTEQTNLGIKSILIISSFHQEETGPFLLFTPNWYTYGFINTGGHFGSYIVDNQEIENKLMMGNYFKTKYIFRTIFLENWEMTEMLKQIEPQKEKTITEKSRSILFEYGDNKYEDILDFLLRFQIIFKDIKKNKVVSGGQSVISTIKDNPNKMVYKTYKIPSDSFIYILRTKYVQGWEPVLLNFTSLVENSKFKLRLHLNNNSYLYYEANRSQNNFVITIYQNNSIGLSNIKDLSNNDKIELSNIIEKMDKINSYNFINLVNQNFRLKELKSNSKNSILLFHNNQYEIMNDLCNNIGEWGKYFKIKRICFRFTPQLNAIFLQQFLNEISFILGKKINKFIFVKQSESQKKSQKIDEIESSNRRVMFTKINFYGNIIQLELAFLRFIYNDIVSTLDALTNKLHNRKFKWGVVDKIPNRLVNYFKDNTIVNHSLFHKKWILKTKNKHYKQLFKIYWQEILKKTSYEQFYLKNNQVLEKNYYKIIELKIENAVIIEKVTFLKVKQSHQKDTELLFQIAIPPCLVNIYPYFKDQDTKAKSINVSDLIGILTVQLKKMQEEIIKLIDTYQIIHLKLLRNTLNSNPKLINHVLEKENSELYDIKQHYFRSLLSIQCKQIISKYYRQNSKEILHTLPVPTKFLMNIQLDYIEGDVNLKFQQKQYSFFLCTPYKFIYLYQKQQNLYYKVVSLYYQQYNVKQNQSGLLQKILKEIIYNINEQIYCKDFKIFLEGNFKGGIAKIINNQQFTHMEENKIKLQALFSLSEKYTNSFTMEPQTIEYQRLRKMIQSFTEKLFQLIYEFFPLLRVNYYFQVRKEKILPPPFSIQTAISRLDTDLFMRVSFQNNEDIGIDITPQNLTDLIMKNYFDIIRNKVWMTFRFYLKVRNTSQKNQNSYIFLDYFTNLIDKLIKDVSFEIQRILIIRKEFLTNQIHLFHSESRVEIVKLQLIKEEESQDAQSLCKYIQNNSMQHYMRFKRIQQSPAEFIIVEEEQSTVFIEKSILMRIKTGLLLQFIYRPSIFFYQQQLQGRNDLHSYMERLTNFINASRLVKQLTQTYELPLEPYQLYLNESANHPNNKIIAVKKKKVTKNPATKYLRKAPVAQETPTANNVNTMSSSKTVPLNLIYRNYLPLNERIPNKQSLQALKQDQIFKLGEIHNLKNTYLFLNFCQKNHIIFHFEEKQDENLIREISEQNKASIRHKCKKYLLYYVFCVNPLVSKESIQKLIYQPLKKAINKKLFDEVSNYLLTHSALIQQDEEYFIKGSGLKKQSKQFKFDLPQHFYKDQLLKYLIQHIEIYHFHTVFKSESEKQKSKPEIDANKFVESIRIIEPNNIENTKIYSDYIKQMGMNKRSVSYEDIIENLTSSTNLDRTRFSDLSFLKGAQTNSMLKSSDFFFHENQSFYKYDYLDNNWLFNSARPKFNLSERYGKCLYLLKLKIREELNRQTDRQCLVIEKHSYLFSSCHEESQLIEFKKYLMKKFSTKLIKRDSYLKSCLCFEITDHVGIIKFTEIQQTFSFMVKSILGEYYIENYFYVQYKNNINKIYKFESNENYRIGTTLRTLPQNVEYSSASSNSSSAVQTPVREELIFNQLCLNLLQWKLEVDSILQQISSLLFFKYKSSNVLIKQLSIYFIKFLEEFQSIVYQLYKNENMEEVSLLIYLELTDDKYVFWRMTFGEIGHLKTKFQGINLDEVLKLGFILADYFQQINSVISNIVYKRQSSSSQKTQKLDLLKYFKSIKEKQDGKDSLFRRSLFAFYQITYEHFIYGSYNINPEIDKEVKDYLNATDCWLHQKIKLYKFIKNIKESNSYDFSFKNNAEKKTSSFYELRYINLIEKPESENFKFSLSMYRLLINLIFNDFPMFFYRKDLQAQLEKESKLGQQQSAKMISNRTRYIHHCTQIRELFQILQNSPVNYDLYNSYKGNEKFILEKLGREYVSILREQYSIQ